MMLQSEAQQYTYADRHLAIKWVLCHCTTVVKKIATQTPGILTTECVKDP